MRRRCDFQGSDRPRDGKEERVQRNVEEQKAVAAAAAQNVRFCFCVFRDKSPTSPSPSRQVKLAFLDDRKRKMMRDERERELREARESAQSASAPLAPSPSQDETPSSMPGLGYTLATVDNPDVDQPPPYHD